LWGFGPIQGICHYTENHHLLLPVLGYPSYTKFLGEIGYTSCMIKSLDKDELIKRIGRLRSNNPMSKIEEEINERKHVFWG
jgi:hypothetical protein